MNKKKVIGYILWGVVAIESVILTMMIVNRVITLEDKVEKIETQITQIEKGI